MHGSVHGAVDGWCIGTWVGGGDDNVVGVGGLNVVLYYLGCLEVGGGGEEEDW